MHLLRLFFDLMRMFLEIFTHILKLGFDIFKVIITIIAGTFLALFFKNKKSKKKKTDDFEDEDLREEFEERFSNYNEDIYDTFHDTYTKKDSEDDDFFNLDDTYIYTKKENKKEKFKNSTNFDKKESKYINELYLIKSQLSGYMEENVEELINVTEQILTKVEEKVSLKNKTYKTLDYYLPTTIKLLEQYVELNNLRNKTTNVKYTLNDIESSMDTIISAFYKILDNLYEDSTANITEEINHLRNAMSKDGLI